MVPSWDVTCREQHSFPRALWEGVNAPRMAVNLAPPLLLPEEVHNTRGEGLPRETQESRRGAVGGGAGSGRRRSRGMKDPVTSSVGFSTW